MRCTQTVATPAGTFCTGVSLLGETLVVSIRPLDNDFLRAELALCSKGAWGVRRPMLHVSGIVVRERIVVATLTPQLKTRGLVILDGRLEPVAEIPVDEAWGIGRLLNLWTDREEFLALDWHNQVHHVGEALLRPKAPADAPPAVKKKPTKQE